MMYSVLDLHRDNSWWYHPGATYETVEGAEGWIKAREWMRETRPLCVVSHSEPFPKKTLCSKDLDKGFCEVGYDTPSVFIGCEIVKYFQKL